MFEIMKMQRFDYIVIEASGICEPEPIAQTLCSIPHMGGAYTKYGIYRLDCITTVVDALRLQSEFSCGNDLTRKGIDEEDIENQRFQAEYDQSPLIETIKKLVKQGNGHWEGSAQEIKDASKYLSWEIYDDVRKIGKQINRYEPLLHFDGIKIDTDRSSRGRKYIFNVIHDTNVIDDTNNTNVIQLSIDDIKWRDDMMTWCIYPVSYTHLRAHET